MSDWKAPYWAAVTVVEFCRRAELRLTHAQEEMLGELLVATRKGEVGGAFAPLTAGEVLSRIGLRRGDRVRRAHRSAGVVGTVAAVRPYEDWTACSGSKGSCDVNWDDGTTSGTSVELLELESIACRP